MKSPTPYREGKPLEDLIPPDRRRRRAIILIASSMVSGAALWVLGSAVVETVSLAADPSTATNSAKKPDVMAAKMSPASGASEKSPPSLELASRAAIEGRADEVRRLLEARVRAGHGSADEARLVRAACSADGDRECIDDLDATYPRADVRREW